MSVGLFLDVDGVLTEEPVNMQYASLLGVRDELSTLEVQFARGEIGVDEFNSIFVPLFRNAGFSRHFIETQESGLRLRSGAERLLQRTSPPYLISSGPDYFVKHLAAQYKIPGSHVLCATYLFDDDENGLLRGCADPVPGARKGDFVRFHRAKHFLSIGVGDNPEQDSPFLASCDVKVLVGQYRFGYLSSRDLASVAELLDSLEANPSIPGLRPRRSRPKVFIGSSAEALDIAAEIHAA